MPENTYPDQYPACVVCGADEGKHCTVISGTGVPGDVTGDPRQWPHYYRAKPGQPGPAQPFVAVKDEPNHYRSDQ